MKSKLFGVLVSVLAIGSMVYAESESINPVTVQTRQISLYGNVPLVINGTAVTATAAQINSAGSGSTAAITPTTINGKAPVLSTATSGTYLMQSGQLISTASSTESTQTFSTVYFAAPHVTISQVGSAVATNAPVIKSISTNAFVVIQGVSTNFEWISYGTR